MNEKLLNLAEEKYHTLTELLIERKLTVSTMESCTSGLAASLITDTEGASAVFPGAAVAYSNEQKIADGISADFLQKHSVYSVEMAEEMAACAKRNFHTDMGIGLTGCFTNADPANPEGIPGCIYYAVILGNRVRSGKLKADTGLTRMDAKLTAAEKTAEEALYLLREHER